MHPKADTVRFIAVFGILTTVLGWLFWSAGASSGSNTMKSTMLAIPVVSAMLASVGFGWGRKLAYASSTLGLYMFSLALAEVTGLQDRVGQQLTTSGAFPSVFVTVYVALLTTFPFVMLVLFVGKTPSLLWRDRTR